MKIKMYPRADKFGKTSGIARVLEAYEKYLPKYGIEFTEDNDEAECFYAHIEKGSMPRLDVLTTHGMYFTADYNASKWEYETNARIVEGLRVAKQVTVPSAWVAEIFQRDMRINPTVVGHGIDWDEWQEKTENLGYVLWNKNRTGVDVCSGDIVRDLANRFEKVKFLTTFAPEDSPSNVEIMGLQDFLAMKKFVQRAGIYLAATKETFGIGILEAMASGVPVLGYAHGGILDLVKHGVNGYLARPNDLDDLSEGLNYCLKYRNKLGNNGREMAKAFTWDDAARKIAEVLQRSVVIEPPTVAVVIPSYNYAHVVGKAVQSALNQSHKPDKILVVDDGSIDGDTEQEISKYPGVEYIYQDNSGVATARNHGILEANTKYIVCLDADDEIAEDFIQVCLDALEADPSLGIAYTKLRWVRPVDGKTQIGGWPREFDFDKQLKGLNQVPTCCMFRRQMWERLGGYRGRYAPKGAGSEDAEFWLRGGSIGYNARLVDKRPLFIYNLGGQTTGDRNYHEMDWTAWHPWCKDLQHPLASLARPHNLSHKVRQYDEPIVSVVIPVGPGHEAGLINALDSLDGQTFRKWEVIVVNDTGKTDWENYYRRAFPFVRWVECDGNKGAGFARNRGVERARAPFLFFLDADDWIYSTCLEKHLMAWKENEGIVYSDYVGKSAVDDVEKLAPDIKDKVYFHENKEAIIGYRAADYDCARAIRQPDPNDIYMWCNVTVLIPKLWHDAIGGYDEAMPTREDIDYHWRLARAGYCYTHIHEELFLYQFNTGRRREAGRQSAEMLLQYCKAKYANEEPKMCSGCGGNRSPSPTMPVIAVNQLAGENKVDMSDANMVLVRYMSANLGAHSVVGMATKTYYGYRSGQEVFLVNKADIDVQPQLFVRVEGDIGKIDAPTIQQQILSEPEDITEPEVKPKRGRPKKQ